MDEVLEKLKSGIRRFRAGVYPAQAEHYQRAVLEPQRPSTLIVTCADSRVQPDTLTQALPGEIFISRNIGNMVPTHGEMMGAMSAVLEYAVAALGVRHVVICGHTDCGAMKALLDPASVEGMPTVKQWLTNAYAALPLAEGDTPEELLTSLTEQNVLLQMRHLKTHPSVIAALKNEQLTISGWVYDIGEGQVRICEAEDGSFLPVQLEDGDDRRARVVEAALAASIGEHK